jgi:hypothetical protein
VNVATGRVYAANYFENTTTVIDHWTTEDDRPVGRSARHPFGSSASPIALHLAGDPGCFPGSVHLG